MRVLLAGVASESQLVELLLQGYLLADQQLSLTLEVAEPFFETFQFASVLVFCHTAHNAVVFEQCSCGLVIGAGTETPPPVLLTSAGAHNHGLYLLFEDGESVQKLQFAVLTVLDDLL